MFRKLSCVLTVTMCIGVGLSSEPRPGNRYMEDGLAYQIVQVNAGRKVSSFTSYKDVVLTEYVVPRETEGAVFGFSSLSAPAGCSPDKTISVYIQHGGYPLFIDGNSSWPDHVFANRSDFAYLEYPATESTWKISLPAPRSGRWFSAVFVKQPTDHIKQTGLFVKCEIMYFSSFLVAPYTNPIIELESGQHYTFRDGAEVLSRQLFKMCLTDERVDYVDVMVNCALGCPIVVKARSDAIPSINKSTVLNGVYEKTCSMGSCILSYFPIQQTCQYIHISFTNPNQSGAFTLSVSTAKCRKPSVDSVPDSTGGVMPISKTAFHSPNNESYYQIPEQHQNFASQPLCPYVLDLSRLDTGPAFATSFGMNHYSWPNPEFLFIPRDIFSDTILRFEILPYKDTGGTLYTSLNISDVPINDLHNISIIACLSLGMSSRFNIENACQGPMLKVNASQPIAEILLPYPEIGTWHWNIQGQPWGSLTSNSSSFALIYIPVKFIVKTTQCVKGSCGLHGTCRVSLNSGVLITSSCTCQGGWKGFDCSNGDSAESMRDLFVAIFFLTISNLFFIPATIVAIKRKYYTEALVYFCTCFFSSFYHACDQPLKRLALCIMDFGVLQFCDFYVSILSFWVTIIAMADLPTYMRSLAHMAGCIGIALGVEYEKTGLWVFAAPALTALAVLAASWALRSYRLKQIVPKKKYWLAHFLPGFLFASLGLMLFAFVETKSNYKFVHSVWHIVMALAVVFFLPPIPHRHDGKYPKIRTIGTDSTISTSLSLSQELAKDSGSDSLDAVVA